MAVTFVAAIYVIFYSEHKYLARINCGAPDSGAPLVIFQFSCGILPEASPNRGAGIPWLYHPWALETRSADASVLHQVQAVFRPLTSLYYENVCSVLPVNQCRASLQKRFYLSLAAAVAIHWPWMTRYSSSPDNSARISGFT